MKNNILSYESFEKDDKYFNSFTGMKKGKFDILFEYLNPGKECENIKYYYRKHNSEEKLPEEFFSPPSYSTPESKPGRRSKMKSVVQLFMFLTWLRLGFSLSFTSWLFKTPKSTVSRYLITRSNFMYLKLGAIPIWPNLDQLKRNMPKALKRHILKRRLLLTVLSCFVKDLSA